MFNALLSSAAHAPPEKSPRRAAALAGIIKGKKSVPDASAGKQTQLPQAGMLVAFGLLNPPSLLLSGDSRIHERTPCGHRRVFPSSQAQNWAESAIFGFFSLIWM